MYKYVHVALSYALQGLESFALYESLKQLHRSVFVLSITCVSYSFVAIAFSMIKVEVNLYSQCAFKAWRFSKYNSFLGYAKLYLVNTGKSS